MKVRIIFVMLLSWCLLSAMDVNAQGWKGKGRVRGSVTDTQGQPIDGANVRFSNAEKQASVDVQTKSDGKWVIAGIRGGNWNVDITKEGYKAKLITYGVSELSFNKPIDVQMEKAQPAAGGGTGQKKVVPGMDLVAEGNKLLEAKDYAGAITKYEGAIAANPALSGLYGEIGSAYEKMNEPDKAIDAYKKFLEKNPTNVDAKIALANLYLQKKSIDEAKAILGTLKLEELTNPNLVYNLGVQFYNAGLTDEALKYFQKAVEMKPDMVEGHFQLGVVQLAMKDTNGAKAAFQKVIELAPGTEDAKVAQEFLDTMQ